MTQEEENNLKAFYKKPHHFGGQYMEAYRKDISFCIDNHCDDKYATIIIQYYNGKKILVFNGQR